MGIKITRGERIKTKTVKHNRKAYFWKLTVHWKKTQSIFKKLVHNESILTDLKLFAFPALRRIFSEILTASEHRMQ
jgi:hypothetical protein